MKWLNNWIFEFYKKLLTNFGDIYCAFEKPKVKAKQIRDASSKVQTGDIICRGYTWYLDGIFIPGQYTHSGIVGSFNTIYHSIAEGVVKDDIIDFIKDTDSFIILKPQYKSDLFSDEAINKAEELFKAKTKYDFLFKDDNDSVYCHEFTTYCLNAANIKVKKTLIKKLFLSKEVYLAQNIIDVCDVVYEFTGVTQK